VSKLQVSKRIDLLLLSNCTEPAGTVREHVSTLTGKTSDAAVDITFAHSKSPWIVSSVGTRAKDSEALVSYSAFK
jgi:uncharacterized protein involved in copper resistance